MMKFHLSSRILAFIAGIGVVAGAAPAHASRVITMPFAEVMKPGQTKLVAVALEEAQSTDNMRTVQRLDIGLSDRAELGVLVVNPENKPATTQFNLQYMISPETASRPTISMGVWDAGHLEKLSGEKSGGSLFLVASKSFSQGKGRKPIKVNLGVGTNRLEGIFGGVIVPFSGKAGVTAEYAPEKFLMPGTDSVNVGLYYFPSPNTRIRVSSIGGNPQLDLVVSRTGR